MLLPPAWRQCCPGPQRQGSHRAVLTVQLCLHWALDLGSSLPICRKARQDCPRHAFRTFSMPNQHLCYSTSNQKPAECWKSPFYAGKEIPGVQQLLPNSACLQAPKAAKESSQAAQCQGDLCTGQPQQGQALASGAGAKNTASQAEVNQQSSGCQACFGRNASKDGEHSSQCKGGHL